MKQIVFFFFTCGLFLYLLCFPAASLEACSHALSLWSSAVVPALLPLMILSRCMISFDIIFQILKPLTVIFRKLFSVSEAGTYAVCLGCLCGYPMGVKIISDLIEQNRMTKKEGQYLAVFVNNVSPGFVITYVSMQLLHDASAAMPFLVMIYGSSVFYGMLLGFFQKGRNMVSWQRMNGSEKNKTRFARNKTVSFLSLLDDAIESSILQILKIGGYMILFSILSSAATGIPVFSQTGKAVLAAILEISYGADQLAALSCSISLKYLLLILCLTFGGLCSAFQSASYLKKIGVTLKKYIKTKAMITIIALLCYLVYANSLLW